MAFRLDTWEIRTQTVPPFLADQGYTPRIFVNRVADAEHRTRRETASRIETKIIVGGQVTPVGELASYFGVYERIKASQHSLGIGPSASGPRIEIEVLRGPETAWSLLRGPHAVRGWTIETGEAPIERTEALIGEIAFATLGYIAPFEALAYDLVQDSWVRDYDKTIARASGLLSAREVAAEQRWTLTDWVVPSCLSRRTKSTSSGWETNGSVPAGGCTEDNNRLGRVLRGVANLNAQAFGQAFEDLRAANAMGSPNALATAFLGDALLELGNGDAAQERYDEARGDPRRQRSGHALVAGREAFQIGANRLEGFRKLHVLRMMFPTDAIGLGQETPGGIGQSPLARDLREGKNGREPWGVVLVFDRQRVGGSLGHQEIFPRPFPIALPSLEPTDERESERKVMSAIEIAGQRLPDVLQSGARQVGSVAIHHATQQGESLMHLAGLVRPEGRPPPIEDPLHAAIEVGDHLVPASTRCLDALQDLLDDHADGLARMADLASGIGAFRR